MVTAFPIYIIPYNLVSYGRRRSDDVTFAPERLELPETGLKKPAVTGEGFTFRLGLGTIRLLLFILLGLANQ